jgi:nucleoside-diphosphate-sugar epimerase
MTTTVAVLGAGGKMGFRVTRKIRDAGYDLRAVEMARRARAARGAGIEAWTARRALRARR